MKLLPNSNKNSLKSTAEKFCVLVVWALAATVAPSCSTERPVIADPLVFPATDLKQLNQYDYEIGAGGIQIELSRCALHREGSITASLDFLSPSLDETVPIVVVFALEGLGIEYLVWDLPPGESASEFDTRDFSNSATNPLAQAISMSVPGATKCFVAIVGFEDDRQRRVAWPNSVVPLALASD